MSWMWSPNRRHSLCRNSIVRLPMPILCWPRSSSNDRVQGLEAGADDYVVKPFNLEELIARIRALLRRGKATLSSTNLTWEKLQVNPDTTEVTYAEKVLHLTPKEYNLLELFLRNPRRIFSRSAILDRIWSAGEFPQEEAVTAHIKGLRQMKQRDDCNLVETCRLGIGSKVCRGLRANRLAERAELLKLKRLYLLNQGWAELNKTRPPKSWLCC